MPGICASWAGGFVSTGIEEVSLADAAMPMAVAPLASVLISVAAALVGALAEPRAFEMLDGDERVASVSRSCEPCDARNGSAPRVRS